MQSLMRKAILGAVAIVHVTLVSMIQALHYTVKSQKQSIIMNRHYKVTVHASVPLDSHQHHVHFLASMIQHNVAVAVHHLHRIQHHVVHRKNLIALLVSVRVKLAVLAVHALLMENQLETARYYQIVHAILP